MKCMPERIDPKDYPPLAFERPPYDWKKHPSLIDWQDPDLEYGLSDEVDHQQVIKRAVEDGFAGHWRRPPDKPIATLVNQDQAFLKFNAGELTVPRKDS